MTEWSPCGSEVHWAKLAMLVEHVEDSCGEGSPERFLCAVEVFALAQWLKVAGGRKGALIEEHLGRAPHGIVVELGTFVGYTTIRLGRLLTPELRV